MLESQFEVRLPEFHEAIHIIGFDDNGEPIVPSPASVGLSLTHLSRISDLMSRQLRELMSRIILEAALSWYSIVGRKAAIFRNRVAVLSFFAGIGAGLWAAQ
jgi:hypothetical protein